MKNIIILGSKGNIGSSLIKYLKKYKKNFKVIGFDLPKYDLFKKDFFINISKKIDKKKGYILINCTGLMGADLSKSKIENFFLINGVKIINPLFFLKEYNIEKYILLSSETVYGKGLNKNENSKKNPLHPYGYSKLFAELNLKNSLEIIKNKTIKTIIIRLPVVVFKSKKNLNTLSSICSDFKNKKKILIFGNGKHRRKYLYAHDLNNLIRNLINYRFIKNVNILNSPGFICNSIDIVKKIENLLKIKKKIQFENSNKAFSLTSSDNKIKKIIKFKLKYNLNKTIKHLLKNK